MSWSYDPTLAGEKDRVRLLIGDTDETSGLVQDEEINFFLAESGNSIYRAAAQLCRAVAAKFARKASLIQKDSGLHDDTQAKADRFLTLADDYERRAHITAAVPFAGGISEGDKVSRASDADAVRPSFTRDLHASPSAPGASGLPLPN